MANLNALLKKQATLEAEITKARKNEKRKLEVADLIEKAQVLDFTDAEILAALKTLHARNHSASAHATS